MSYIQLDWPYVAGWAYASIFAVAVRFQIHDQFWIPRPKLHGTCTLDFFSKIQKMSPYGRKWCFWRFQRKFDCSSIIAIYKQFRCIRAYNYVVRNYEFKELCNKLINCTSYRVYLVLQSISIEINQDRFLSKNTAAGLPKKPICCETKAPQKHLRHPYQRFRRGASSCAWSQAPFSLFGKFLFKNIPKNKH